MNHFPNLVRLTVLWMMSLALLALVPRGEVRAEGIEPSTSATIAATLLGRDGGAQAYVDPRYGFTLTIPDGWHVAPATADGVGAVTTLTSYDPEALDDTGEDLDERVDVAGVKIEIGLALFERPAEVPLAEWAYPHAEFADSLDGQSEVTVAGTAGLKQAFKDTSTYMHYLPFGTKVFHVTVIPVGQGGAESAAFQLAGDVIESFQPPSDLSTLGEQLLRDALNASEEPADIADPSATAAESVDAPTSLTTVAPAGYRLPFEGQRNITTGPRCSTEHQGRSSEAIDFGMRDRNRRILATNNGQVVDTLTGWNDGFGNLLKVRHDDGLVSWYAHLDSFAVSVGNRVSIGQLMAHSGSTGNSTGPHLHFEVRHSSNNSIPIWDMPGISFRDGCTGSATGPAEGSGAASPPAAPSELRAEGISSSQIRLRWRDNSNNEDGFRVFGHQLDVRVAANTTEFVVGGLPPNSTSPYYDVVAYNSAGESSCNCWQSGTTLAGAAVDRDDGLELFHNQGRLGSISPATDVDEYFINLTQGQKLMLVMAPQDRLIPYMHLMSPDGTQEMNYAGGGLGTLAVFRDYTVPYSGRYRVWAASVGRGSSGNYMLTAAITTQSGGSGNPSACQGTPINLDSIATGTASISSAQSYCFTGAAGQWVSLRAVAISGNLDPIVRVYNTTGGVIGENDDAEGYETNSFLTVRLLDAGTYRVAVEAYPYSATSGAYRMHLSRNRKATVADTNSDCRVNSGDQFMINQTLGVASHDNPSWSADVDLDGTVTALDLSLVMAHWNRVCQ